MLDYPIKLGTALFTLVEPRPGHEVAYNRWYERDHFYAGCLVGPWCFAGRRFVATRRHKELRVPQAPTPMAADPMAGSYLALYWILAGHHDEWNRWAVEQVNRLHADGRMFAERDHVHTALYRFEWGVQRDPEGVPAELALDHPYAGLAVVVGEVAEGADRGALDEWYRTEQLPSVVGGGAQGSPVGLVLSFSRLPLLDDAPADVPREEGLAGAERRFLQLWFCDADPAEVWAERFAGHAGELAATGLASLVWAAPFIPTVPGTDTHADDLR